MEGKEVYLEKQSQMNLRWIADKQTRFPAR